MLGNAEVGAEVLRSPYPEIKSPSDSALVTLVGVGFVLRVSRRFRLASVLYALDVVISDGPDIELSVGNEAELYA